MKTGKEETDTGQEANKGFRGGKNGKEVNYVIPDSF